MGRCSHSDPFLCYIKNYFLNKGHCSHSWVPKEESFVSGTGVGVQLLGHENSNRKHQVAGTQRPSRVGSGGLKTQDVNADVSFVQRVGDGTVTTAQRSSSDRCLDYTGWCRVRAQGSSSGQAEALPGDSPANAAFMSRELERPTAHLFLELKGITFWDGMYPQLWQPLRSG